MIKISYDGNHGNSVMSVKHNSEKLVVIFIDIVKIFISYKVYPEHSSEYEVFQDSSDLHEHI